MTSRTIYRHSTGLAIVDSPDKNRVVVMPLSGTQPYVLTDSAAVIWGLVDGKRDVNAIIDGIRIQFPDAGPEIDETAHQFLQQLMELQIMEPVPYGGHEKCGHEPSNSAHSLENGK